MNLLLLFLEIFLASLVNSFSDIYNTPICATFNNVNMTFPNVWQMFNVFKATGQLWVPVATGACFENSMDCTILSPVCAVSKDINFKTFPNQCLLQAEQKATGTEWNIVYNGICLDSSGDDRVPLKTASSFLQDPDFYDDSNNNQQYYDSNAESTSFNNTKTSDSILTQSVNYIQSSTDVPAAIYPTQSHSSSYDNSPLVASGNYKPVQIQQSAFDDNLGLDLQIDKSASWQSQNAKVPSNSYQKSATNLEILGPMKLNTPRSYNDAPVAASEQKLQYSSYSNKPGLQSHSLSYDTAPSPSTGQQSYTSDSYKQSSTPNQVIAAPSQPQSSIRAQPSYNYNEVITLNPALYLPSHLSSSYNSAQSPTSEYYREQKMSLTTNDYNHSASPNLVNLPTHVSPTHQVVKSEIFGKYNIAQSSQVSNDFNHNSMSPLLQKHSSPTYDQSPPRYVLHNPVQAPKRSFISDDSPRKIDKLSSLDFKSALKPQLPISSEQQPNTLAEDNQSSTPGRFVNSQGEHSFDNYNQHMASNSSMLNILLSRLSPSLNITQRSVLSPPKSTPLNSQSFSCDDDATSLSFGHWNSSQHVQTWSDHKQNLASNVLAPVALQPHLPSINKGIPLMGFKHYDRREKLKTSPTTDNDNDILVLNPGIPTPFQTKPPQVYNVATSPATGDHHTTTPLTPNSIYLPTVASLDVESPAKSYSSTSAVPEKYNQNSKRLTASTTAHSISENLNHLPGQTQAAADSLSTTSVPKPDPTYNRKKAAPFLHSTISSSAANTNAEQISHNKIGESNHQTTKRNLAPSEHSYGSLLGDHIESDSNQDQADSASYSQHLNTNNLLQMIMPVVMQKHSELPHLINKICLHVLKFLMIFL